MPKDNTDSLSHTRWNCKYHIVFAPKFRRQAVYGKIKTSIGKLLQTLCEQKKVEILETEACTDHIHMLVSIHAPAGRGTGKTFPRTVIHVIHFVKMLFLLVPAPVS